MVGKKLARRGSFLGNEASRVAIIFATSGIPVAYISAHYHPSVRYLVFPLPPPPLCLFLAFRASIRRAVGGVVRHSCDDRSSNTRETQHGELRYLSFHPSPFIVIHAFYGPCYTPVALRIPGVMLCSATRTRRDNQPSNF